MVIESIATGTGSYVILCESQIDPNLLINSLAVCSSLYIILNLVNEFVVK